jgi:NAD(P)-dependent dehydrogenase (short-subunit alcohol dehydrogenase family)
MHTLANHPFTSPETLLGHFDNLKAYNMKRYADSKLTANAFARKLATVVSSNHVIVNTVCPGIVATDLEKSLPAWVKVPYFFIRAVLARKVDEGSRTLVYASVIAGPETHGRYLNHNKLKCKSKYLPGVYDGL